MEYFQELGKLDRQLMERGLDKRGISTHKGLYDLNEIKQRIRNHDRGTTHTPEITPKRARLAMIMTAVMGLAIALLGAIVAFFLSNPR